MASLKSRISRLKALGLTTASELGRAGTDGAGLEGLAVRSAASGRVSDPRSVFPGDEGEPAQLPGWTALGQSVYTRTIETGFLLPESSPRGFSPSHFERAKDIVPGEPEPDKDYLQLSFFDLETTGLSGGTGTIAFLAALGYFEGRDFLVTQVFIDDYPGEALFLGFVASVFAEHPWAVTYNGAAFDIPLLRTRCIMNGAPMPELRHTDLLKQARRLWKRSLGPCSLKALEARVLGFEREGDVPGFLIPRIWLDYSSGGGRRTADGLDSLGKVFEHNAQDVLSLARLFLKVDGILRRPLETAADNHVHLPSLGLELIGRGRAEEGLELLEAQGGEGDQFSLHLLARIYRRSGRWDDYRRVIGAMDPRTVSGCLAKAKLAEHRDGDFAEALAWAERATQFLESSKSTIPDGKYEAESLALSARTARLERKLGRNRSGSRMDA